MSCKIQKNKNGKINKVLDMTGNPSTLFKQILNVPILNLNEALETYKNIYSDKLKNKVQFQILGEKGAKNLDQIEEATFRMDNLLVAKEMEQVGKSPKEIRLLTGWEKNLSDQKWKYEIQDVIENSISVEFNKENKSFTDTNIATVLLLELYNNQDLYKAYPTLEKTPVIFYNDTSFFGNLNCFAWQGRIFLNAKYFIDEQNKYRRDLSDNERRFTLQHEIQHILQDIEGFDRGTSAKTQEKKIKESLDYIRDNKGKTRNSYDEFLKNYLSKDVNFFNRLLLKTLPTDKVASILAQKFYLLKAGEVEARNVQLRAGFTAQERLEKPLFETQQVPYEKQLVDVSEQDKDFIMANLTSPQNKTEKQQIQEQLKLTGLAKNVYNLSNAEIEAKLIELGVDANIAKQVAQSKTGYYSNALASLANLKDKNPKNIKGWISQLTDVQKNGGIKNVNQELEWIGLEDYLNDYVKENNPKVGNIPSSVVEDYIKSNQIEIVEVSKGYKPVNRDKPLVMPKIVEEVLSPKDYIETEYKKEDDGTTISFKDKQRGVILPSFSVVVVSTGEVAAFINNKLEYFTSEQEAIDKVLQAISEKKQYVIYNEFGEKIQGAYAYEWMAEDTYHYMDALRSYENDGIREQDATKYSGYQLKVAENYREVLLMMPQKKIIKSTKRDVYNLKEQEDLINKLRQAGYTINKNGDIFDLNGNGIPYGEGKIPLEVEVNIIDYIDYEGYYGKEEFYEVYEESYTSSHWSEKNILAHVRLNEKTLPDGRRVLILNEIQADISQDLKKEQDKILDRVDKEFDNFLDNLIMNKVIIEEC